MKTISKIDLVFENCEAYSINRIDINEIIIEDIKEKISKIAANAIASMKTSETILIHVSNNAEEYVKYQGFQIENENPKGLMRIAEYNDITQIILYYDDNTSETIYPSWIGESEYSNDAQETYIIENCKEEKLNGYIIVIITDLSKKENILTEYLNSLISYYGETENSDINEIIKKYLIKAETLEDKRKKILEKLTPEEMKILGLN